MWFARLERTTSTSGRSSLEGGSKGTPLVVENAGHEHLWTHSEIAKAMLGLLRSKDVRRAKAVWPPIKFVPIEEYDPEVTHPAHARR